MMKKTLDVVPESDRSNILAKLPTYTQLEHAILRNFGGHKDINPMQYLKGKLPEKAEFDYTTDEVHTFL